MGGRDLFDINTSFYTCIWRICSGTGCFSSPYISSQWSSLRIVKVHQYWEGFLQKKCIHMHYRMDGSSEKPFTAVDLVLIQVSNTKYCNIERLEALFLKESMQKRTQSTLLVCSNPFQKMTEFSLRKVIHVFGMQMCAAFLITLSSCYALQCTFCDSSAHNYLVHHHIKTIPASKV